MTNIDLYVLLPLIVLAGAALLLLLQTAFYRCHILSALLALSGIALSFATLINVYPFLPHQITAMLILDHYAFFYIGLILAASFIITVFSYGYLKKHEGNHDEFYILLLLAIFGSAILITSSHFASLFLGRNIECKPLCAYCLSALQRIRS